MVTVHSPKRLYVMLGLPSMFLIVWPAWYAVVIHFADRWDPDTPILFGATILMAVATLVHALFVGINLAKGPRLVADEDTLVIRTLYRRHERRWSEISEISHTIVRSGRPYLALTFSSDRGRLVLGQAELDAPIADVIEELIARTGARGVPRVERLTPGSWPDRVGSIVWNTLAVVLWVIISSAAARDVFLFREKHSNATTDSTKGR